MGEEQLLKIKNGIEVLKVLVGSRAHGLADENSDYDYRSIFVVPTREILAINNSFKKSFWEEGESEDNTSWELGHFLHLATKSNPSILEVFKAPRTIAGHYGEGMSNPSFDSLDKIYEVKMKPGSDLQALFPWVWSSKGVYEAFSGYSKNQQTKLFSDKEEFAKRKFKYAVAYIRVLLQGIELLTTNNFSVEIQDRYDPYSLAGKINDKGSIYYVNCGKIDWPVEWHANLMQKPSSMVTWKNILLAIKNKEYSTGRIIDVASHLKECFANAYDKNPNKQTDYDKVNEFLLKVRREIW